MSERYGMFLTFQLIELHLISRCPHWNASGTVIYSEKCLWVILNAPFYWQIDLDLCCRLLRELTVRINSHWNVETGPRTEAFFKVSDEMGWYSMAWHGMAWYGTGRDGTGPYGTGRHGLVWYGMVRYGTVRHGTARYSMVRYGMVCSLHNAMYTMSLSIDFQTRVCQSNHSVTSHFTPLAQKFSF